MRPVKRVNKYLFPPCKYSLEQKFSAIRVNEYWVCIHAKDSMIDSFCYCVAEPDDFRSYVDVNGFTTYDTTP